MKCSHRRQRYKVAAIYVPTGDHAFWLSAGQGCIQVIGQCTCERCGEVVTWGDSNDEPPEVKVEIRAAEQVACAEHSLAMATAGEPDECICKHGKIEAEMEDQARDLYLEHWQ